MIIRTARSSNFTVISNDLINDECLDWKDLGMLVYLLSKPDNWQISVDHLKKQKKLGRDGIYKCLDAIIQAGYAKREKQSDGKVNWLIFDSKQDKPNPENPEKVKDSQIRKSRNTENPNPENPTLINTNSKQRLKKDLTKTEETNVDAKADKHVTKKPFVITSEWQPGERCVELIARAKIPHGFAVGLIDEFVLYWEERAEKRNGWDATFLNHVKRSWEREQKNPNVKSHSGFKKQPLQQPVYDDYQPSAAMYNEMQVISGERIS